MIDDAEFETFARAHGRALLSTGLLLTGSRQSAEDLVQETLAYLYPRWEVVTTADAPVAYVRRCLTNRFVSSRRGAQANAMATWELPDIWDGRDLGESVATRHAIWQSLGTLPARQRAAIVLRYYHGLTDDDIAEILVCRPASARSLISRGLRALRSDPSGVLTDGKEALR